MSEKKNVEKAENIIKKAKSTFLDVSFDKGEKLNFGNTFSNVNKAFLHVLFNKGKI
ncbi:hypothetical protein ABXT43_07385 [Candidatus Pelagibacter sp. Uisw_114]